MLGILSIIVFLPVLMAIPTYILGKIKPKLARIVCIGTTTALFGLTMLTLVFYRYGSSTPAFQLVDTMPWGPSFGLNYISVNGSPTLMSQVSQMPMFIQLFASVTTFIGFAVKLPIVPFHTWLPDAHVEAPAPVSVLLAGLLLKMGGYGFIRYNLLLFSNAANTLWPYFAGIGLITMIYGATVALVQTDLKRMIAMTSINHMDFVLLGTFSRDIAGVSGAVFQMFNHALAIGILFLMSGYIHEHMGTRNINELGGLRGRMPLTATLLVFGSLAAMAIPGLSNFISEYLVIAGALTANPIFALAIIAPALTVGYFLWMLRRVVLTPATGPRNELHLHSLIILAAFLVPLFILGAYPGPMLDSIIRPTVLRFFGGP